MTHFTVNQKQDKQFRLWLILSLVTFVLSNYPAPDAIPITGYNGYYVLVELILSPAVRYTVLLINTIMWLWMLYQLQKNSTSISNTLSNLWIAMGALYVLRTVFMHISYIHSFSNSFGLNIIIQALNFIYCIIQIWIGCILTFRHSGRIRQLGIAFLLCSIALTPIVLLIMFFTDQLQDYLLVLLRWLQMLFNAYLLICMRRVFKVEVSYTSPITATSETDGQNI